LSNHDSINAVKNSVLSSVETTTFASVYKQALAFLCHAAKKASRFDDDWAQNAMI
jgi:hypothetical protein